MPTKLIAKAKLITITVAALLGLSCAKAGGEIDDTASGEHMDEALRQDEGSSMNEEDGRMRVLIDPGHTSYSVIAKGIAGREDMLNLETSQMLKKLLDEDGRFYCELTRHSEHYKAEISNTLTRKEGLFSALVDYDLDMDKRGKYLNKREYMEIYALRYYAYSKGFDILLSIHYDYGPWPKGERQQGFHLIVSPYSGKIKESVALAYSIRSSMLKRYSVRKYLRHNSAKIIAPVERLFDSSRLLDDGIVIRSLSVLGDAWDYYYRKEQGMEEAPGLCTVMAECGFVSEQRFAKQSERREVAKRLYEGLSNFYEKSTAK